MSDQLPDYVAPGGQWGRVPDRAALQRLPAAVVHKLDPLNVLLSRVDRTGPDTFDGVLVPDWDHPLFFEHPLDHVPSMMMVEACRQLGIAIAHLHLGVALGTVLITTRYEIGFTGFAEVDTDTPVVLHARVTGRVERRGRLHELAIGGHSTQGGRDLGGMSGAFAVFPRETYVRLRRRFHGR
ncbi:MAG: AfsA-related hotdog domain-containing protein [Myxococcota bacterium]